MKLFLTKTTDERTWACGFHDLFCNWLFYNDIFIGEFKKDWELKYNDFYHFYDLSLFEIEHNAKQYHFEQVQKFFEQDGYMVKNVGHTYRWRGKGKEKKEVPGVRIWIFPKDFYDIMGTDILSAANEILGDIRG